MVKFTVWTFPTPYGAGAVVTRLKNLCTHELIRIGDAVLISWPQGRPAPLMVPLADLPRGWKLDDAFWGLLVGVLFHCDQEAAGPVAGANEFSDGLAALGISTEVLDIVRARIVEGTSALVLLIEAEVARRIAHAFDGMPFALIEVPILARQELWLRTTFSALAE